MSILIHCPRCKKSYQLKDDLAGKRVKCKCGQPMQVPDAVKSSDPLDALLNDALPPPDVALPAGARPSLKAVDSPAKEAAPAKPKKKRKKRNAEPGELTLMARVLMGVGMIAGLTLVAAIVVVAVMYSSRPGYPTPEETFAAHQEALEKGDWKSLIRTYTPESQEQLVGGMLAFASMPMIEPSSFVEGTLKKHGVDGMLQEKDKPAAGAAEPSEDDSDEAAADGEEDSSEEEEIRTAMRDWEAMAREAKERRAKALAAIEDKAMFYVDFMAAIEAEFEKQLPENPVLKIAARKAERNARQILAAGKLGNVKIDGDKAAGEIAFRFPGEKEETVTPVAFKQDRGRWFIDLRSDEDLDSSLMRSSLTGSNKFDSLGL